MRNLRLTAFLPLFLGSIAFGFGAEYRLFDRTNLVAWCIVPFDAKKRGPEERAAMLERLRFSKFAYDYRAEHIPQWEDEVKALGQHHVELTAWWFPTSMNDEARNALKLFASHHLHPQLWVMGGGAPTKSPQEQEARIEAEARRIREIAAAASNVGCAVALYNHGAWFGEPENQVAIIEKLRAGGITNVGIVYNLHHGHDHLARLPQLLQRMRPYLLAINLNGMVHDGERLGQKIVPLGQGDDDLAILRTIQSSGWRGLIGILNHTDEDAEGRLRDNLEGLDWLVPQLEGKAVGARPKPGTWKLK